MCRRPTILRRLATFFFFFSGKKNERLSCSLSRNKQKHQEELKHHRRFYIRPVILLGIFLAVAATSFYAGVIIRTLMMISHSGSELKLKSFKQAEIISKQLPPANANAIPGKEKNIDDDMVDNMRNEDSSVDGRDDHEVKDQARRTVKNKNKINYEALVHPSMITHHYPKKVMIIESLDEVDTSAIKREVLKHASVEEVVVVENENNTRCEVAGSSVQGGKLFDVIIAASPVTVLSDAVRSHASKMFNCLEDEGILVLNFAKEITYKDSKLMQGYLEFTGELEKVGFESIHMYEDESNSFETRRSFLVALKAFASRADWFSNEAEILIRLHQRINKNSLNFVDAPTMLKYQTPSKVVETAYCRGGDDATKKECKEFRGFDPQLTNIPVSDFSVAQSGMGEHSGRGLFAMKDILEGQTIGVEKWSLSYFFLPSTHQIIKEMSDWAEEHENEAFGSEVLESFYRLVAFETGYGFWSVELGRAHATVDSGAMMFCNHGCNGSYNLGIVTGFTEVNVDLTKPPKEIIHKPSAFNPVKERNIRQYLVNHGGGMANRNITQGEELLCDYLQYVGSPSHWEKEIGSLRGQCDGSEVGDITNYEYESRQNK